MKALSAVLLFMFCACGSIYCYAHNIGDGSTYLGIIAVMTLFLVWDVVGDDS